MSKRININDLFSRNAATSPSPFSAAGKPMGLSSKESYDCIQRGVEGISIQKSIRVKLEN